MSSTSACLPVRPTAWRVPFVAQWPPVTERTIWRWPSRFVASSPHLTIAWERPPLIYASASPSCHRARPFGCSTPRGTVVRWTFCRIITSTGDSPQRVRGCALLDVHRLAPGCGLYVRCERDSTYLRVSSNRLITLLQMLLSLDLLYALGRLYS